MSYTKKTGTGFIALIQARCGSSRLPNKVLLNLAGKPVLQRVIERVRRSAMMDEVCVVTSIERNNLPLIQLCTSLGCRVYVGAEDDVLDRYYQAATLLGAENIVRITADCPLFDWRYLDMAVHAMRRETDYLGEITETFPDGLDLEIVRYPALRRAWTESKTTAEREHVTLYLKRHPELFLIQDFLCPIPGIAGHRWTLDEDRDYAMISAVYEHFTRLGKEDFVTEDILEYLAEHNEIAVLNQGIVRNEGLMRSIDREQMIT